MSRSTPLSDLEVLQVIAELVTTKRKSSALAHYPTLRIQTNNLNSALKNAIKSTDLILDKWSDKLALDNEVAGEFVGQGMPLFPYRTIAPFLVHNVHRTADFLLGETLGALKYDVDDVGKTVPSFSHFVTLGSAVRGFIDALVQTVYQLVTFDSLQLNYKFLQSLLSFAAVAPPSLHANVASSKTQAALNAYTALSNKEKKDSAFTKATHDQFGQRLSVACKKIGFSDERKRNIELLFSFCSDFIHSGYASILATSEKGPGYILGWSGDAFVAEAENFSELKQRLLAECAGLYANLLVPALSLAIQRTLANPTPSDWSAELDSATARINDLRTVLNQTVVKAVRKGVFQLLPKLPVDCVCGNETILHPPFLEWHRFCSHCGSRFCFPEVNDNVDYVVSSVGIGDVLGSDAPRLASLDAAAKAKLQRIMAKHALEKGEGAPDLLLITDLERIDEDTLEVPFQCTSTPDGDNRKRCQLLTFVAAKSLERCKIVRIRCNCGVEVDYSTAVCTNICQCPTCQQVIGLIGVSGEGDSIMSQNPDGSPKPMPIQARNRFKVPNTAVN
jgi:hypothetical protein